MSPQPPSSIETEFTERYDREHARGCGDPRPPRLLQRLSAWRDARLVRQALKVAGEPGLILDLACGSGRFWPVLAEHVNRVILASDNSQSMLDHARTHHPGALLKRVKTFQGSAFSIGLSGKCGGLHFLPGFVSACARQRCTTHVVARVSPCQPRHGDRGRERGHARRERVSPSRLQNPQLPRVPAGLATMVRLRFA